MAGGLQAQDSGPTISDVIIEGNRKISHKAIASKLMFKPGDDLKRYKETSSATLKRISNMGYFTDESIFMRVVPEPSDPDQVKIVIGLEEKRLMSGYEFEGNNEITTKKLKTGLGIDSMVAVDRDDVERMCRQIELMYKKENYLSAKATGRLDPDGPESYKIHFTIEEGLKTRILKVNFVGCKKISERQLRNSLFTREDWLFSPLDSAGKFDKEMIERDKRFIEQFYQEQGYLNVSIADVTVKRADNKKDVEVTFFIEEGELYQVNKIGIPYDDEFNPLDIERAILLREESPYSLSALRDSVTRLEYVFGEGGYIYLNVYPEMNPDHSNKTVEVNFKVDKGERCIINEIEITGNKVTKDYIIRRELLVQEGQLAKKSLLDHSRDRVEYLDYFERGSVDWKIHKIDDGKINLELVVQEKRRSGQASFSLNYGPNSGGKSSPAFVVDVNKRNLMGMGVDVGAGLQISDGAIRMAFLDFENPNLFDKDIHFGCRTFVSRTEFDSLDPVEDTIGAIANVGFFAKAFGHRFRIGGELGFEGVDYKIPTSIKTANGKVAIDLASLASMGNDTFKRYKADLFTGGDYAWVGGKVAFDRLNYRVNPTKGWSVELRNKFAFSGFGGDSYNLSSPKVQGHSMAKVELDAAFYWPITSDERLVFSAKSRLGIAEPLGDSKLRPIVHKEMFKVGGLHSVRGFRWGEAGPMFRIDQDSYPIPIGSKRMFLTSLELTTPLGGSPTAPHVFAFYDMGSGWNSQKINLSMAEQDKYIINDKFSLRHSVGFGIKFSAPYPIRIDYGYKLDRRGGESPSELNISMNLPF